MTVSPRRTEANRKRRFLKSFRWTLPGFFAPGSGLDFGPDVFYGIRITATGPITTSLEHWDRDLGGGFATIGIPGGTIVPLSSILVI